MRWKRSLVTQRRKGSSTWYANFRVNGHRFRGSLETDDRETAEILAAKIRSDALLGKLTDRKSELTLTQALARYWLEHGQFLASRSDIERIGKSLQAEPKKGEPKDGWLGKHVPLSEISAADLTSYAARRRAKLSNAR
jgi:hypothetical protein